MNLDHIARVERAAVTFFEASAEGDWDRALSVTAPGMTAWQSGGHPIQVFADLVPQLRKMREKVGSWTYEDVRRIASEDGFCEQHAVRFGAGTDKERVHAVCVVATVNADGLITHLDEYVDPHNPSTWELR